MIKRLLALAAAVAGVVVLVPDASAQSAETWIKRYPPLPANKPVYLRGDAFRVNCMDMYNQALACAIRYPYPKATGCRIYINADKINRGTALARYAEAHERKHCAGYTHSLLRPVTPGLKSHIRLRGRYR